MKRKEKEEINHGLKLLVKSSIIVLVAFIFSKILGYLYRIIIARYFGPEVYGIFSLSIIIVGWFAAVASLGFVEGIVRYISFYRGKKERKKIRYLISFSSKLLLVSTIISAVLLFALSKYISVSLFKNSELIIFLKIFSVMLPFWVFAGYFLSIMRGFEKIREVSILESIVQNVSKVGIIAAMIFLGFNVNSIIFSFFTGIIILFLASFLYCKIKIPEIFIKSELGSKNKSEIRSEFISYSWPILFFGIISSIFYWIDSFSIGFFKSVTEVGFYNAVIPIAILLNIAPEIFMQLFFPMITRDYPLKKMEVIRETSRQVGKWILMINLPVFFLMMIFPAEIIQILFGSEYIAAADSLRILSLGGIFSSMFMISNNLLSMAGKSKIILCDIIFASILNIILNIILIPMPKILFLDNSLGTNGAAIATMISVVIFNLLFLFQARHYTSIVPLKRDMFRITLASIIALAIVIFLKTTFTVGTVMFFLFSALFVLTYILLLLVFRIFDNEDKMIFETFRRKIRGGV